MHNFVIVFESEAPFKGPKACPLGLDSLQHCEFLRKPSIAARQVPARVRAGRYRMIDCHVNPCVCGPFFGVNSIVKKFDLGAAGPFVVQQPLFPVQSAPISR